MANPGQAISVAKRIAMMPDFIEHPGIVKAVQQLVPVTMPPEVGALGFDIPLWVGLGIVGLWAALDALADRAELPKAKCDICEGKRCIPKRFARYIHDKEQQTLQELEDLRHLYAHNYAGEADDVYFRFRACRHILEPDVPIELSCGALFNGRQTTLKLSDLRMYSGVVQTVAARV